MNRQLTDKEIKAAYKYVGKHSASPVITGMQMTTIKHDLPPAASCQVKAVALLKAGGGVWGEKHGSPCSGKQSGNGLQKA